MNIKTWVLAAILICGTSVFTSCSSDNIELLRPKATAASKCLATMPGALPCWR